MENTDKQIGDGFRFSGDILTQLLMAEWGPWASTDNSLGGSMDNSNAAGGFYGGLNQDQLRAAMEQGMQHASKPPERTPEMGKMVDETTDLATRAKKVEEFVCRIVDLLVGPLPNTPEGARVDTQTASAAPRGILGTVECDLSSVLRSLERIEAAVGRL